MALSIVDPNSTELEHLASVDVKFSGVHIGGGIYFSANHFPTVGGTSTAVPQSSLIGQAELHATTEIDFTLPDGGQPWNAYRDDPTGAADPNVIKVGFDLSLHVGDRLSSTGEFYAGPAVPLLIANDPNNLSGTVTITGYPDAGNSLDGNAGTLHQTTGTLLGYFAQTVNGDEGGYFEIGGTDVVGGMSGGGNFLDFDPDGDGNFETYLIAATSRTVTISTGPDAGLQILQSTAYAPFYDDLAAEITALTGNAARTADDFARMTLLSAQSLGSALTTVQGQFFHEDIFGGINADTLLGAGGDDRLYGRQGGDSIDGGTGADTIDGGGGGDTLTGGAGGDWFGSASFGNGASDVVTDFEPTGGDVIDLSAFFANLDEVRAAITEPGDGSIVINLGLGSLAGALTGGSIKVLGTVPLELTTTNVNVACFAAGTRIGTPSVETKVEDLRIGDHVRTDDGRKVAIRWIGRQTFCPVLAGPRAEPVRIRAGALGNGLPHSDLTVTADHGMILDGLVINAGALVNGTSIDFVPIAELPARMTVYHIETLDHDTILANGAPAETFIDYAGRRGFDNFAEYLDLYGAERIIPEMAHPRISAQRLVPETLRARLGIPPEPALDWTDQDYWNVQQSA